MDQDGRGVPSMGVQQFYKKYYTKEQLKKQKETILEVSMQQSTYYSTACTNSFSLFCQCNMQMIAVVSETGDVKVGYAVESEGFPHKNNPHILPICKKTIPLHDIQEIKWYSSLCLPCLRIMFKGGNKWNFYFNVEDICKKWVKLLVTLRSQQLQRLGKSADIQQLTVVFVDTKNNKKSVKIIKVVELIQKYISDLTRVEKLPLTGGYKQQDENFKIKLQEKIDELQRENTELRQKWQSQVEDLKKGSNALMLQLQTMRNHNQELQKELRDQGGRVQMGKSEMEALKKSYQLRLQQSEEQKYNLKQKHQQLERLLKETQVKNEELTQELQRQKPKILYQKQTMKYQLLSNDGQQLEKNPELIKPKSQLSCFLLPVQGNVMTSSQIEQSEEYQELLGIRNALEEELGERNREKEELKLDVEHLKRQIKAMGDERKETEGQPVVALEERSQQVKELEREKLSLSETIEELQMYLYQLQVKMRRQDSKKTHELIELKKKMVLLEENCISMEKEKQAMEKQIFESIKKVFTKKHNS